MSELARIVEAAVEADKRLYRDAEKVAARRAALDTSRWYVVEAVLRVRKVFEKHVPQGFGVEEFWSDVRDALFALHDEFGPEARDE